MNIKPLSNRIVVKPDNVEQITKSGIIIPDTANQKPKQGIAIAVGKGLKDEPMTVQVGDHVLFGEFSGTEIEIEKENYLIMKESDILLIL